MALGYFKLRKIIPSAAKTIPATSVPEARQKSLALYRSCLRYAGEIQTLYPLDIPIKQIRHRMRLEFDKNRYVNHLPTINALLMKGNMELEETLYMWKTKSHVMKYFKEPYELEQEAKKHDFLHSFMAGPNRLPT